MVESDSLLDIVGGISLLDIVGVISFFLYCYWLVLITLSRYCDFSMSGKKETVFLLLPSYRLSTLLGEAAMTLASSTVPVDVIVIVV